MTEKEPVEKISFERIKSTLDKKGIVILPQALEKNFEEDVIQLLDTKKVSVITGEAPLNLSDKREEWPTVTYLYDPTRIEEILLGEHDDSYFILTQPEDLPWLSTAEGTVLLRPLEDLELQTAS